MPSQFVPPTECPVCGERVPPGAKACPHCGADERAGWDEEASLYDDLDLPEEAFVDEKEPPRRPPRRGNKLWIIVAAVLLVLFILSSFIH